MSSILYNYSFILKHYLVTEFNDSVATGKLIGMVYCREYKSGHTQGT